MNYLEIEDVRALHDIALELDGGARGERAPNGLESALAQPGLEVFGRELHKSLEEKAAAYLYHLCQAHAFVDGNKRTALAAMLCSCT